MSNVNSVFRDAAKKAFDAQMAVGGETVIYGGVAYQAIRRDEDQVFDANFGGYIRMHTYEFKAEETPDDGTTMTDGAETFRVEGVVLEKAHSKRVAVSRVS